MITLLTMGFILGLGSVWLSLYIMIVNLEMIIKDLESKIDDLKTRMDISEDVDN